MTKCEDDVSRLWSCVRPAKELLVVEHSGSIYVIPREKKPIRLTKVSAFFWKCLDDQIGFREMIEDCSSRLASGVDSLEEASTFLVGMLQAGFLEKKSGI